MISNVFGTIKSFWTSNGKIKFLFVALGILVSFVYVGVFQEKIMRGCYGGDVKDGCKDGEKFRFATSLVFVKSFCGLIFIQGVYNKLIQRFMQINDSEVLKANALFNVKVYLHF